MAAGNIVMYVGTYSRGGQKNEINNENEQVSSRDHCRGCQRRFLGKL